MEVITCAECGKETRQCHSHNKLYCSDKCRRKSDKRTYRARKRTQQVHPVSYDALYVRDGGICMLCGNAVDRSLKNPHVMSGTIDHIIPLSKGGAHSTANTQLAHMICNSRKGATMPDRGVENLTFGITDRPAPSVAHFSPHFLASSQNPLTLFDAVQVEQIRKHKLANRSSNGELATLFNCSESTICGVINHAKPYDYETETPRVYGKLTLNEIEHIRTLKAEGMKTGKICKQFPWCDWETIRNVIKRKGRYSTI